MRTRSQWWASFGQRLLHEVLGDLVVAADQVCRPHQCALARADEGDELLLERIHVTSRADQ
ncbi:hypothetical protein [Ornithinimicrobium cryptoxanthini]|uniref:hypothetical protein n=1 Tax=Ornithinimicrobium cryptoxanthini TaxID=2934161 RepID=UPI0021172F64|nr:hypothetical protein [Ornithinimicrobium cryptoxanthini]